MAVQPPRPPAMKVVGEVLTDVAKGRRGIDWITVDVNGGQADDAETAPTLEYFYARGGCDLLAVSHYFTIMVREVHGEFTAVRKGANYRLDHSVFARYALAGITAEQKQALTFFGLQDSDFKTVIPALPKHGEGVCLLSFWADVDNALYRHRATGAVAPLVLAGVKTDMRDLITLPDEESGADPAFLAQLREEFEYLGCISENDFKENLRLVLNALPEDARVFILLANDFVIRPNGVKGMARHKQMLNTWLSAIGDEFPQVALLRVRDFIIDESEVLTLNHFDRMVYFASSSISSASLRLRAVS